MRTIAMSVISNILRVGTARSLRSDVEMLFTVYGRHPVGATGCLFYLSTLAYGATECKGASRRLTVLDPPEKETLTLEDLAKRYYVNRRTVLKWAQTGMGPRGQKIGKQWLFSRQDVLAFERARKHT